MNELFLHQKLLHFCQSAKNNLRMISFLMLWQLTRGQKVVFHSEKENCLSLEKENIQKYLNFTNLLLISACMNQNLFCSFRHKSTHQNTPLNTTSKTKIQSKTPTKDYWECCQTFNATKGHSQLKCWVNCYFTSVNRVS